MPKLKTKKAAAKRIWLTKRGKLKRFRAGTSHLMGKKSAKRRRHLRRPTLVAKVDYKNMRRLLPYGRK